MNVSSKKTKRVRSFKMFYKYFHSGSLATAILITKGQFFNSYFTDIWGRNSKSKVNSALDKSFFFLFLVYFFSVPHFVRLESQLSKQLPIQSELWKHKKKMWSMFKANNETLEVSLLWTLNIVNYSRSFQKLKDTKRRYEVVLEILLIFWANIMH